RRGVEHVVDAFERGGHAVVVAHVTDVKLELGVVVAEPHVFLLLLVAAEDANLANAGAEESLQHGVPERAGPAGNQQRLVVEHAVCLSTQVLIARHASYGVGSAAIRSIMSVHGGGTNPVMARNRDESRLRSIRTASDATISVPVR